VQQLHFLVVVELLVEQVTVPLAAVDPEAVEAVEL